MTWEQLLEETAKKKEIAVKQLNEALNGNCGFLVKAEIERNPGMVAWLWLAKYFCETLAENMDTIYYSVDEWDQREIYDIYTAYEDDGSDLYDLLPTEARLFD